MDKNIKPDELMELYQTARQIIWRYNLDKMEIAALKTAMKSIEKAAYDILSKPSKRMQRWEQLRRQDLIQELESLTVGIREQVTGEISSLASQAGAESANYHSQTMSVGGKLPGFNNVALSPEQFKAFFETIPMGGYVLSDWVNRAFDATVQQGLLEDLGTGMLQGKGYPGLVDSIMGHMKDFTRKEAVTLARTFVQTANVSAMSAVMAANSDIVRGWRWSSVMEGGNIATGRGTCLICSALDSSDNVYPIDGGPKIPAHLNCRCVQIPITVTFRELGIDIDEFEEVARPWTTREDIPIGEGGRTIIDFGQHHGNYESWMKTRGEAFQKNVLGPKRYELWKSGKVKMIDMVDIDTMRLKRIDNLL